MLRNKTIHADTTLVKMPQTFNIYFHKHKRTLLRIIISSVTQFSTNLKKVPQSKCKMHQKAKYKKGNQTNTRKYGGSFLELDSKCRRNKGKEST